MSGNELDEFHDPKKPPHGGPYKDLDEYLKQMRDLHHKNVNPSLKALEGDIAPNKLLEGKKNTGIISGGDLDSLTKEQLEDVFPDN